MGSQIQNTTEKAGAKEKDLLGLVVKIGEVVKAGRPILLDRRMTAQRNMNVCTELSPSF